MKASHTYTERNEEELMLDIFNEESTDFDPFQHWHAQTPNILGKKLLCRMFNTFLVYLENVSL